MADQKNAWGYPTTNFGTARVSRWWEQEMSDSGQALFMDPQTGLTVATMPDQIIAAQQAAEEDARAARGGFLQNFITNVSKGAKRVDGALSNIPGWGITKGVGKAAWYPVDKLASGAYWIYSNAVSQPLSTALLQASKAELAEGGFWEGGLDVLMSGDEWEDAYGKAEHISPAQAFINYENTMQASGEKTALGFLAADEAKLSQQDRDQVNRQTERFLYDTEYWREKQGWTYTVGTGALDFMLIMGADPVYAGLKVGAAAVKGARSIKVADEGAEIEAAKGISAVNILADYTGKRIGQALAKTPEEASRSKRVNNFFDWAAGKTPAEIAQHPIWGRGRRVNPARDQLSQVMSHASRDEMPLMLRFAMGDNKAAAELVSSNADIIAQIGKMSESRVLVDSARFDSEIMTALSESAVTESRFPVLADIPPRPTTPGPRQSGWDKTYGDLADRIGFHRAALAGSSGVRGLGPAAQTSFADVLRAEEWKAAKVGEIDGQLAALESKSQYYSQALGSLATKLEDFSPGQLNIFGTAKSLYRQGPLALRSAEASAEKGVARLGQGRQFLNREESGFTSRILRNGFYTAPVRVWQSFGERLPQTFINHNDDDAYMRVAEMLKQVPNLAPDARLNMIREYSQAGDKIARAEALDKIHTQVVNHMVSRVNGLDEATSMAIDKMRQVGFAKAMNELTGQRPNDQMYSAALKDESAGFTQANRVDFVEHGEGHVIAPTAKSQLSYAEPLLNVRELDRLLKRNSSYLGTVGRWSRDRAGDVGTVLDSINSVWKAGTLLRPGYTLRSMSEEQVASAVKFGLMSTVIGFGKGGWNWALNRKQQIGAVLGPGSYVSAKGTGKGYLKITDEAGLKAAEALGLPTERVNISNAWPVVQATLSEERSALKAIEDEIAALKADPQHDPTDLARLQEEAADRQNIVGEFSDYATALLQEAKTSKGRRLGEGAFEHEGILVPEAFSSVWENPIPRDQITSARAMETIFARAEAINTGRLIKTGDWAPITPGQPNHMDSWLHGINNQYRQDELYRIVASDPTLKSAKAWVKTPAGKHHMSQLGVRARDPQATIESIKRTLDVYLPPGTGLQDKLAKGEQITETELRAAIAADDFPTVHGEELKALTARHSKRTASRVVDDMIEKGFKALATVPNDIMARQPIYLRAQEARMRDLISQELAYRAEYGLDDTLSVEEMNKLLEKSDKMARKDISQVVYDPTRTTATEALRFISPFLSAHLDGLQRWGGLIAEKPQMLGTAARIYNAPVAAGLVTDRLGRPVGQDGNVTKEDGSKEFVPLAERVMTLRLPGGEENVKGVGKVKTGGVRINLQSLNTILPGDPWFNPGAGPYAQFALSEVAKRQPALGDFMQWAKILPYGPSNGDLLESLGNSFTPAYMRDAWEAYKAGDPDGEEYQKAWLAEFQRQSAERANGGDPVDLDEVEENAKNFVRLHALTNWLMPARNQDTPLTGTPFQFFIDQYKVMQEVDPKNAQANFMAKYGQDYFVFTAAMSKSLGIASTVSAEATAQKYKDLIAERPEMAALIVGDVYNKGGFSNSVYRKQFDELIGGEAVRKKMTAEQAVRENQRDLGWQQYAQSMNLLDAALIRSGFKSYADAGAEPFREAKRMMVEGIRQGNDAWYEDWGTTNRVAVPMRIEFMKKMFQDQELMSDPMRSELHVLQQYIAVRDTLKAQLNARGQRSVSFTEAGMPTGDAQDIGYALRKVQLYFMNMDTRFSDVFHRYLENDDLS